MRVRFTAKSSEWWDGVLAYAEATNRTPSELVCEALDQIQARYPKRPRSNESEEERIIRRILDRLPPRVPAGTLFTHSEGQS
jgi:hypothetical protein